MPDSAALPSTPDPFADLQELARLRLARRFDESARARAEAIRKIREKAAANGLHESSGVVWGQKVAAISNQLSDRALAIAQVWHALIKENRGEFTDEAQAFILTKVRRATESGKPAHVEGASVPPWVEQRLVDADREAGHRAEGWLAERRAEARLARKAKQSGGMEEPVGERDALTRLLDRGAFDSSLASMVEAAASSGEPLSLIILDIDRFKTINDTHGHPAGDGVLREVSRRIDAVARSKGLAFRYGGEELAVLLPNHESDEALAVAERMRRAIEASPVGAVRVTASLGVSTLPRLVPDAAALLATADKAMYDAKRLGRNLVRLHGEPGPSAPEPRVVERKQPTVGWLTEEQKAELRHRIIRGFDAECPDDGAPLDVRDATNIGSPGKEFIVICPDCGKSDRLPSPPRR